MKTTKPTRFQITSSSGLIDAEYEISQQNLDLKKPQIQIRFWSAGGGLRKDYNQGLRVILERLNGLELTSIEVNSRITRSLPEAERYIQLQEFSLPLVPVGSVDANALARAIQSSAKKIGQQPNASGGNDQKTLLLDVTGTTVAVEQFLQSCSSDKDKGRRLRAENLPLSIAEDSVLQAISRIDSDGFAPHHKNHTFELIHDGRSYPPLAVLAFAIEHEVGSTIPAGKLRGEANSREFQLLRNAGFSIAKIQTEKDELERRSSSSKRKLRDKPGSDKPNAKATTRREYDRDQDVVDAVLLRAKGVCEGCGWGLVHPPGFNKRSTETAYLEVHHVIPLPGPDRTWNAVALCANCHARCHYGEDGDTYNDELYDKVKELRRPDQSSAPTHMMK